MGRTTNKTMQQIRNFKLDIFDIYRMAALEHNTHKWVVNTLKTRVYDRLTLSNLTTLQEASLFGYVEALADNHWHVICTNMVWFKNEFVKPSDISDENYHLVKPGAQVYRDTQVVYFERPEDVLERGENTMKPIHKDVDHYTNMLYAKIEEGTLDKDLVITAFCKAMSEDDIYYMMKANEMLGNSCQICDSIEKLNEDRLCKDCAINAEYGEHCLGCDEETDAKQLVDNEGFCDACQASDEIEHNARLAYEQACGA